MGKKANGCHNCSATRRDYAACDQAACVSLCGEMYRTSNNDEARCIRGCNKYAYFALHPLHQIMKDLEPDYKRSGVQSVECTASTPCGEFEGDCDADEDCQGALVCIADEETGRLSGGGHEDFCGKPHRVTIDRDLGKSVPHTLDMISLNVHIYNSKTSGQVKAKTTGNEWKIVHHMQDPEKVGRMWLAEFEQGKTCAVVVRGTKNFKGFLNNLNIVPTTMPGTDYKVIKGYQDHIMKILRVDNNQNKVQAWLQTSHDRHYMKIFSGHSLGGAVATWLSMFFETKKESLRPDYVVTFGAPRVVASLGSNRCPRSLQTRKKAVRIVIAETMIGFPFVDAATLLPEPPMNFCFQSLQMDNHGRLIEEDNVWPNFAYLSVPNHLINGWTLHSSEKKYEPYLLKVKEKKNEPCLEKGKWCDNTGGIVTLGSRPSCSKCCNGKRINLLKFGRHECK